MKPLSAVICLTFLSGLVFGADDARDKCQRCHESVVLRKVMSCCACAVHAAVNAVIKTGTFSETRSLFAITFTVMHLSFEIELM